MLVFEVLVGVPSVVLYGLNSRTNTDNDDVYMIYNPGRLHFEAVRNTVTKKYTITFAQAETLRLLHPLPDVVPAVAPVVAPVKGWFSWASPASVAAPQPVPRVASPVSVAAPEPVPRVLRMASPVASSAKVPKINWNEYYDAAGPWGEYDAVADPEPNMNNDVKEEWNRFLLKNIGIYRLTNEEINNIFDTYARGNSIGGVEIGKILLAMNLDKDIIKKIVLKARGNSPARQYPEKRELNREEFRYAIRLAENVLKLSKNTSKNTKDWVCPICSTINFASAKECSFCNNPKPASGGRRKTRRKRGTSRQVPRR
jgi:hypothetical protein